MTSENTNHIWETLEKVNVNEHTEQVGKFTYLSWTWAWATLMEHYPQAKYVVHDDVVFPDGSREVRVSICIKIKGETVERMMWLPVTNYSNKAIINPNSFEINTARMRCLTKCMAMFGLGHYIYAGENIPMSEKEALEQPLTDEQRKEIDDLLEETNADVDAFLKHYEIESVQEMSQAVYDQALKMLQTKQQKQNSKPQAPSEDVVDAITHGDEPDIYEEEAKKS
tara:strand:- start:828 stop:1502 length:675 start_codon:yes stop_codon:yes gene_type:complete